MGIDTIKVNYTTLEDKYECEAKLWEIPGLGRSEILTPQMYK